MAQPSPENRPGVMERVAVISAALSVAVMILTLAVVMGFKSEISSRITGFSSHAVMTDIRSVNAIDANPVHAGERLEGLIRSSEGFVAMARYALKGGIIRTSDAVEGVLLKGVGEEYNWQFFEKSLLEGELPRVDDSVRTKDILISKVLADRLLLGVGDRVEMLFVEVGQSPRRDRFKVCGLFSTGMDEMDKACVLTDIRNVQRLWGWSESQITGYQLTTSNLERADQFADNLNRTLLYDENQESENLVVSSTNEQYPNIFDWLKAHDVNAAVVIAIMLIVAFFNMASALLILVLERTRMVGLLKALGMRNGSLRRIFLFRAGFIVMRALFWGNAAGLGVCLAQKYLHIIKLSSEGYMLSQVPIELSWGWLIWLNVGVVVAITALLLLPTYIVSTIKPEQTIRYE